MNETLASAARLHVIAISCGARKLHVRLHRNLSTRVNVGGTVNLFQFSYLDAVRISASRIPLPPNCPEIDEPRFLTVKSFWRPDLSKLHSIKRHLFHIYFISHIQTPIAILLRFAYYILRTNYSIAREFYIPIRSLHRDFFQILDHILDVSGELQNDRNSRVS